MPFDADSARALSRRVHSLQDCLFVIKQAVVQAARTVGLSDLSTNNAAFVIDFLSKTSVALHDATVAPAPAWAKRREILQRAGFTTELIPSEAGATLVVRW